MPKGNLLVIRNSDGKVIATGIPTIKSCNRAAHDDMVQRAQATARSNSTYDDSLKESYTYCTPKEVSALDVSIKEIISAYGNGEDVTEVINTDTVIEEPAAATASSTRPETAFFG
jgi:hypothetical protein